MNSSSLYYTFNECLSILGPSNIVEVIMDGTIYGLNDFQDVLNLEKRHFPYVDAIVHKIINSDELSMLDVFSMFSMPKRTYTLYVRCIFRTSTLLSTAFYYRANRFNSILKLTASYTTNDSRKSNLYISVHYSVVEELVKLLQSINTIYDNDDGTPFILIPNNRGANMLTMYRLFYIQLYRNDRPNLNNHIQDNLIYTLSAPGLDLDCNYSPFIASKATTHIASYKETIDLILEYIGF